MNSNLDNITYELFSRNAVEVLDGGDATDALYDSLVEKADSAISEYGWKAVFESWKTYMYENCHTVEEPYKFLAYLYDIFDFNPVKYNAQIMDDVSYGLLSKSMDAVYKALKKLYETNPKVFAKGFKWR